MVTMLEQEELVSVERAIPMRRVWAMPDADTFNIAPIGGLVRWLLSRSKVSIDPFARNKRWATHTNDLNPDTAAECHMDVRDFLETLRTKGTLADLVIFDPPYSPTQIKASYQSIGIKNENSDFQRVARWSDEKRIIQDLVISEGLVVTCGWNSNGMGLESGFQMESILLVAHGAGHNDTIVTVERKVESGQGALAFNEPAN